MYYLKKIDDGSEFFFEGSIGEELDNFISNVASTDKNNVKLYQVDPSLLDQESAGLKNGREELDTENLLVKFISINPETQEESQHNNSVPVTEVLDF